MSSTILGKNEKENLHNDHESWKTQLNYFFVNSGHVNCKSRARIMRLLVEDVISPSSSPESDFKQRTSKTDEDRKSSIYTIRALVMKETLQCIVAITSEIPRSSIELKRCISLLRA